MTGKPDVLLDDDGDLWIDLRGTGDYQYLSPYTALGPSKSWEDLADENDELHQAEWVRP